MSMTAFVGQWKQGTIGWWYQNDDGSYVNVIVGTLIIKKMFDYSDDEMVENLMLDLHLQYALHTTSFAEQLLSDKTLSRFRKRCYDYETLHNEDLYQDCVKNLNAIIAKLMGINGRGRRMDSMMIESNIRKLSRMELLYTCISKFVILISKTGSETPDIIADFEFNEEGTKVARCPAGHEPKSCSYMAPSNQCQVSFPRELCAGCPYQDQCHPKIFKRVGKIVTSKTAHDRAVIQRTMHSEEFVIIPI